MQNAERVDRRRRGAREELNIGYRLLVIAHWAISENALLPGRDSTPTFRLK
jgi:hypothetical protein